MPNKVYYNSACPICNAGITDQRKRMEACGLNNIRWIDVHTNPEALTKIDVLDDFKDLYICIAYKLNGKIINYFPSSSQDQAKVKPIYKKCLTLIS